MSAVARMIKRRGATWYIQNWVEGASSNDYGRTSKTLAASIGFTAIRTETAKERTTIDVSGEEIDVTDIQQALDKTPAEMGEIKPEKVDAEDTPETFGDNDDGEMPWA